MEERPHRTLSAAEVGVADAARPHQGRHPAIPPTPPRWLVSFEKVRPRWLVELLAEFIGVFFYVWLGVGANMAFNITTLAQESGYGSLLNIAICYGLGIAFGIMCAASTSGAHLSPGFTIAFVLFKGFPARKAPQYILAQICGAFCAALLVYSQYSQQIQDTLASITASKGAAAANEINFSTAGPAGAIALFPLPRQNLGLVFLNELIAATILSVLIFCVLDQSNFFVSLASAPFIIGFGYTAIIIAFSPATIALNTARDLGGRFACAAIFGTQAFPQRYSALSALTNILATTLGACIQTFVLGDHRRTLINVIPQSNIDDKRIMDNYAHEEHSNTDAIIKDVENGKVQGNKEYNGV